MAAIPAASVTATLAMTETMTVRPLLPAIAATREITPFLLKVITTVQLLLTRAIALLAIVALATFVTVSPAVTELEGSILFALDISILS